jgi:hypothetical protein
LYGYVKEFAQLAEENQRSNLSAGQEKWIKDTGDILSELYTAYKSGTTDYEVLSDMAYNLAISKFSEYL